MIQINIGDHHGRERVDAFTQIPAMYLRQARWARQRARKLVQDIPSADRYFQSLPNGRTLTAMLNDSSLWVNYSTDPLFGFTYQNNDIWICTKSFRIGRWTVLATLVHELAHVNGAGNDHAAEQALINCGLGKRSEHTTGVDDPSTPYSPGISGQCLRGSN
ncbi:MAG: hypothetical protein ACI87E_002743 [Mariniblastus sp.]|jgi:hypothetical protein